MNGPLAVARPRWQVRRGRRFSRRDAIAAIRFAVLLGIVLTGTAAADDASVRMTGEDVRSELIGRTIEGLLDDGDAFTEVLRRDGTSLYRTGQGTFEGRTRITGDAFCFVYPPSTMDHCFVLWRRGSNCYDFYPADPSGEADADPLAQITGIGWRARAYRADAESTCPADGQPVS